METLNAQFWADGKPRREIKLIDITRSALGEIESGKIDGLALDEIVSIAFSPQPQFAIEDLVYDVVVKRDGTFTAKRHGTSN